MYKASATFVYEVRRLCTNRIVIIHKYGIIFYLMDYLIVPWHLFLANKWIVLNEIALPNSLNCNDTLLISELME